MVGGETWVACCMRGEPRRSVGNRPGAVFKPLSMAGEPTRKRKSGVSAANASSKRGLVEMLPLVPVGSEQLPDTKGPP